MLLQPVLACLQEVLNCYTAPWFNPTLYTGILGAVSNLESESLGEVIHLTWDAPFSLDITEVDPDIWYRVNITVGNSPFSTYCDINFTEFNFTMDGYNDTKTNVIYEFRVTSINGAGNGITSAPVTGYFGRRELMWIENFVIAGTVCNYVCHSICSNSDRMVEIPSRKAKTEYREVLIGPKMSDDP